MKVKFWTCGNCGHEEPITDNDLQELNPWFLPLVL